MMEATPMRRKDRTLPHADAEAILQRGEYGVLASASADGLPLATPLSYVLMDGAIYFHCAQAGHKLDNIAARPQVCFCVVGATQPVYNGNFTTRYESALAHGRAVVVQDDEEKRRMLWALCKKYLPDEMDKAPADIAAALSHTAVVRIGIDHLAGKANRKAGAE